MSEKAVEYLSKQIENINNKLKDIDIKCKFNIKKNTCIYYECESKNFEELIKNIKDLLK